MNLLKRLNHENIKIVFDNSVDLEDEANISSTTFDNIIFLNYENDGVLGDAIGFNAAINSSGDTITVDPDTALIQLSRVLLKVAGDTIVDANNNTMTVKQSRFNVADIVIPEIQSSSIAENNEYVFYFHFDFFLHRLCFVKNCQYHCLLH